MDLETQTAQFRFPVRVSGPGSSPLVLVPRLADVGITAVTIQLRCPRANVFAERFVPTVRAEGTDRMLIFGARHLRAVLTEYLVHYNGRRSHRSGDLQPPDLIMITRSATCQRNE